MNLLFEVLLTIFVIFYTAHAQPTCTVEIPPVDLSCERDAVCPGDLVRCTCSVFETTSLSWMVNGSLVSIYLTSDDVGDTVPNGDIESNFTFFCESASDMAFGDFTSTLEAPISSLPLFIECTNQREPKNISIVVADSPEMPTNLQAYFGDRILFTWDHPRDGDISYSVSYSSDCRSPGSGITDEMWFEIDFADCNELEITLSVAAIDTICGLTSDTATIIRSLPRNAPTVTVILPTCMATMECDDGESSSRLWIGFAIGVGVSVGVAIIIFILIIVIIILKLNKRKVAEEVSSPESHELQRLRIKNDAAVQQWNTAVEKITELQKELQRLRSEKDAAVQQWYTAVEKITELQKEMKELKKAPRQGH